MFVWYMGERWVAIHYSGQKYLTDVIQNIFGQLSSPDNVGHPSTQEERTDGVEPGLTNLGTSTTTSYRYRAFISRFLKKLGVSKTANYLLPQNTQDPQARITISVMTQAARFINRLRKKPTSPVTDQTTVPEDKPVSVSQATPNPEVTGSAPSGWQVSRLSELAPKLRALELVEPGFAAHEALVRHLQFSSDGKYLVASGWDQTCSLFRVEVSLVSSNARLPVSLSGIWSHQQGDHMTKVHTLELTPEVASQVIWCD
jgi:hypothetical protein